MHTKFGVKTSWKAATRMTKKQIDIRRRRDSDFRLSYLVSWVHYTFDKNLRTESL